MRLIFPIWCDAAGAACDAQDEANGDHDLDEAEVDCTERAFGVGVDDRVCAVRDVSLKERLWGLRYCLPARKQTQSSEKER